MAPVEALDLLPGPRCLRIDEMKRLLNRDVVSSRAMITNCGEHPTSRGD
jgi:hypothetical protein